jgi:molybdopterin synthase catalytic subunit
MSRQWLGRPFRLDPDPIDIERYKHALRTTDAGALCTFEGWVRNKNDGRDVTSLEYTAYAALALKEGERVIEEAVSRFDLIEAVCVHRTGHLALGDCAVWVAAVSGHRDEAFRGCRFIIDEIKARVPIWKREHYRDGSAEWVLPKTAASTA